MSKRTHECPHCPEVFDNVTDHLVHASTAHPERHGVGRTRSRVHSCWSCARDIPPMTTTCPHCGWTRPEEGATR